MLEPVLIVPDTHVPYQDQRAWKLFLKVAHALKPTHLYTIGDLLDFYSVSSHSKDPQRARRLPQELRAGNKALDQLDELGAPHKVFIAGNHCSRFERYLQDTAPELFDVLDVPSLLRLKERGWSYVPYKSHTRLGKAFLTHDVGSAGRYAVFKNLDSYQHSIIAGHSHRFAYIVEGNCVGEFKLSASFGWLGDVNQIDYMNKAKAKKDWALGFGFGYVDTNTGIVYLVPVPIVRYTCVINGRLFKA